MLEEFSKICEESRGQSRSRLTKKNKINYEFFESVLLLKCKTKIVLLLSTFLRHN